MTKKGHQKFWAWKCKFLGNFLWEKTSFRNLGPRKICLSPQARRQVSAADSLPPKDEPAYYTRTFI